MYTVKKETEKALLIEMDGAEAWIPKSWVNEEGSLNDSAKAKLEYKAEWLIIPAAAIVEEREKAIKIKATVAGEIAPSRAFSSSLIRDKKLPNWMVWLPKFAMKKDGENWKVRRDFLSKKCREIIEEATNNYCISAKLVF